MKFKSLILGICATVIAATGTFSSYANKMAQTIYYIKIGTTIYIIIIRDTFTGCSGSGNTCRVRVVNAVGAVITQATTVYINSAATIPAQSASALSGTVIIQ